MSYTRLSAQDFTQMILAGHQSLLSGKDAVNALNIFPVPDGDTGTNLSLTMTSGVNELSKYKEKPIGRLAEALATGLLMGARGNSGVILSQLFRGFAKALSNSDEMDGKAFAEALQSGVDTAYRAVAKPVEGTILTVAKDAAKAATKTARQTDDLRSVLEIIVREAEASLQRTPDLLPVLRQAGVVDSGGQGLVFIYRGFLNFVCGEQLSDASDHAAESVHKRQPYIAGAHIAHEGEYGYCTEFMIHLDIGEPSSFIDEQAERRISARMQAHGDSLLVVAMNGLVKVHIHSEHPGLVLETALEYGSLTHIKIDNMTHQHHMLAEEANEQATNEQATNDQKTDRPLETVSTGISIPDPYGIIAVAASNGIRKLLKSIGVQEFVEGGQTMNPSTEDIMCAIARTKAQTVFVLPNNPNIIMAAEQCRSMLGDAVRVIPTRSIPQAIAAIMAFDKNKTADDNAASMTEACNKVLSGQITQAVRNSNYQEKTIRTGDYLGMVEGKIAVVDGDLQTVWIHLLRQMVSEDRELVTVLYGEGVTMEQAEQFVDFAKEQFGAVEFELHEGGQPLYPFLIGVE
ncbi:DAK2 domain-containing protein [Fodinisporobacter ferrooxydans]|uniref:DAK2 domain-containing protein n=1 Tax=Fodinisporobacter ferrooxydans TaxID=2901836 RepID=A0ABY4CGS1_9BACL|nr:DAK2 domain-containing protein [Alicyclobacillaceae bacterium MYW30-H2]